MAPITEPSTTAKMASYLSRLSPVPAFPEYTGPYKVGTADVEIPVSELDAQCPAPEGASDIHTVQFRIYYPAVDASAEKRINWLPAPQRAHVAAYTQFLGISASWAGILSFLPRHLHYTTIPVHKNATPRDATTDNQRWPTMIFSHGLGGSRNSYSYIAGSLASHGIVVICPEHREGSAVATFIRIPEHQDGKVTSSGRREVPYQRIPHEVNQEVYLRREAQLRIRCWELSLVHQAVLALDKGQDFTNLNRTTPTLKPFSGKLNVHEPGSIILAGHSFGAATMTQFIKSTYYAGSPELEDMERPLFVPDKGASIRQQITEKTVTMLLDMWCMPLMAPNSAPLFNLPYPAYADVSTAPGGKAILAVESEHFYKWNEQLNLKARLLSPDPEAKVVSPQAFERPSGMKLPEPNFFWVTKSAHLSQSDFGILFPMLTKKVFDAVQPERALRLNLRAQLQLLRENGVPVARTYVGDLVDGTNFDKLDATSKTDFDTLGGIDDDKAIFDRSGNNPIDCWDWIDLVGLGDAGEAETGKTTAEQVEQGEETMQGVMEPSQNEAIRAPLSRVATATAA